MLLREKIPLTAVLYLETTFYWNFVPSFLPSGGTHATLEISLRKSRQERLDTSCADDMKYLFVFESKPILTLVRREKTVGFDPRGRVVGVGPSRQNASLYARLCNTLQGVYRETWHVWRGKKEHNTACIIVLLCATTVVDLVLGLT